jgi:hypothetical protein
MLQGACDLPRIVKREDAGLKIERIAFMRDLLRPKSLRLLTRAFVGHLAHGHAAHKC